VTVTHPEATRYFLTEPETCAAIATLASGQRARHFDAHAAVGSADFLSPFDLLGRLEGSSTSLGLAARRLHHPVHHPAEVVSASERRAGQDCCETYQESDDAKPN